MKILVYGAGAIGGFLGARLLDGGNQVVMLDRPSMTEAINEQGLIVEEAGKTIHVRPQAVSSLAEAYTIHEVYEQALTAGKPAAAP